MVNLDLEVRVCFQQSLLHCPREPSADSLIPSNQSTTFIQTFISCHLDREALQKASDDNVDLFGADYQFEQIREAIDGVRG